jgi:phage terminase small subunit
MPAKKPAALIQKHETSGEKAARAEREALASPERALPKNAPAALKDHKVAGEVWRRLMRLYNENEGVIVTRMDIDHLVDYCILAEQTLELDAMRKSAFATFALIEKQREEALKNLEIDVAISLGGKSMDVSDMIVKLDARSERKRALLKQYRESLYLTPRARAGAAPKKKEKTEEPDPLEALLDNVNDYVNGDDK